MGVCSSAGVWPNDYNSLSVTTSLRWPVFLSRPCKSSIALCFDYYENFAVPCYVRLTIIPCYHNFIFIFAFRTFKE